MPPTKVSSRTSHIGAVTGGIHSQILTRPWLTMMNQTAAMRIMSAVPTLGPDRLRSAVDSLAIMPPDYGLG
jgi:hypothetical protein